jgi:hypothetical protein
METVTRKIVWTQMSRTVDGVDSRTVSVTRMKESITMCMELLMRMADKVR